MRQKQLLLLILIGVLTFTGLYNLALGIQEPLENILRKNVPTIADMILPPVYVHPIHPVPNPDIFKVDEGRIFKEKLADIKNHQDEIALYSNFLKEKEVKITEVERIILQQDLTLYEFIKKIGLETEIDIEKAISEIKETIKEYDNAVMVNNNNRKAKRDIAFAITDFQNYYDLGIPISNFYIDIPLDDYKVNLKEYKIKLIKFEEKVLLDAKKWLETNNDEQLSQQVENLLSSNSFKITLPRYGISEEQDERLDKFKEEFFKFRDEALENFLNPKYKQFKIVPLENEDNIMEVLDEQVK